MTNKRTTKQQLVASIVLLFMCFSMLLGTTFAWFTDSVTSSNNVITAGKLDVTLEHRNIGDDTWNDASVGAIFNYEYWEPGYTVAKEVKIANAGSLDLKFVLNIVPNTKPAADEVNLADVIDVYMLAIGAATTRDALAGVEPVGTLADLMNESDGAAHGVLYAAKNVVDNTKKSEEAYTIVLKMQESAGNEYQGQSVGGGFAVQVLATQLASEADSFDNQYDIESDFIAEVKNADALAVALKNGGLVKLANDIAVDKALEVSAGSVVELDLNGKALSGTAIKQKHTLVNNGTLTITGGTISSTGADGGSAINNKGTLTAKNVTLNGAPYVGADGWWPSYAVNNTGTMTLTDSTVTAEHGGVASTTGGVVTLNNVNVTVGKNGVTNAALYTSGGGKIIVNGGTYTNRATDQNATGASVVNGAVTVNAGTFNGRIENYYGTPVIKGGTFNANPTRFVNGYEVTNNGDGTWTVDEYKVSTGSDLADAIANGKAVELTQDVNLGKIDLTGAITNDVVIDANGHKITTTDAYGIEVTAGKNVTISNADVEMTKAGDYITYAAGFKIANGDYAGSTITLKDCTITMANTDWAYAVTMPASVKNLNLVIDNCTLEGAVAVQCWGDNNTITITNSKLICNYTTSAMYTSYCVALQGDGTNNSENNTLVIDNCEFLYSGIDNFNSQIYSATDRGIGNTVTVTNCTYGEKVKVAD